MDIPSDHLSLYYELELENSWESERDINIKLHHKADWNSITQKNFKKIGQGPADLWFTLK